MSCGLRILMVCDESCVAGTGDWSGSLDCDCLIAGYECGRRRTVDCDPIGFDEKGFTVLDLFLRLWLLLRRPSRLSSRVNNSLINLSMKSGRSRKRAIITLSPRTIPMPNRWRSMRFSIDNVSDIFPSRM